MARPNARLEAAWTTTLEFMAELDIDVWPYYGIPQEIESLVMRRLEAILTLVAPEAQDRPVRKRSVANGAPLTGHEIPLVFGA